MDAIQDFVQQDTGNSIDKFMIAGESKVCYILTTVIHLLYLLCDLFT